jgi:hypothetical protein
MTIMRLPISRSGLVAVLVLGSLCCATGCKSGAWGWPSSNSNWLSWKNWGGSKPAETALASKPTTTAPKPSSSAIPQPTTSIAAGTGVSAPATSATASATYPTTSQGYASPYATQPASAYQQAGATNQVQPSGGYQTGPYNVNTTAAAGASAGYNQPAATTWNQDTSGGSGAASAAPQNYSGQGYAAQGYGAQTQPSSGGYATAAPSGDYRTADGRSMYGTQEASPYSNDPAQQNSYNAGSNGGASYGSGSYNQPAASGASGGYSAPAASPAGTAPTSTTNPWNSYQAPAPSTYGAAQPAGGNTAQPAAGVGATATTQPAASSYPSVPAVLATSANSYRPGSTAAAGESVQNAAYTQPTANGPLPAARSTTATRTCGSRRSTH